MNREERKHITRIHEASGKLLAAKGYAETYMARREFRLALGNFLAWVATASRPLAPTRDKPV